MKLLVIVLLGSLAAVSLAQVTPFEIGVGYGQSGRFDRDSGGRGELKGPELTISQSYVKLPFVGEARIGASMLFGGQLESGDDTDGTVLRVFARYKSPSFGSGLYAIGGVYWGQAKGRAGSFGEMNRSGVDLGLGMPLGNPTAGLAKTSLELIHHQSARAQFRGWSLGLMVRL
ncbi:MAG TPA: hypothetical protein PLX06_15700 [Fimbriimonadaceae bacterium]|nr:hypothetical protein [Fimbriimonadaceae bacterium]